MEPQTSGRALPNEYANFDASLWGSRTPPDAENLLERLQIEILRRTAEEAEVALHGLTQPPRQYRLWFFGEEGISSYALRAYSPLPHATSGGEHQLSRALSADAYGHNHVLDDVEWQMLVELLSRSQSRAFSVRRPNDGKETTYNEPRDLAARNRLLQVVDACRRLLRLHRVFWLILLLLTAVLMALLGLSLAAGAPSWLVLPSPVAWASLAVPVVLGVTLWLLGNDFQQGERGDGKNQEA